MNNEPKPAVVTEEHKELARHLRSCDGIDTDEYAAQLIADSEARAVEATEKAHAKTLDVLGRIVAERDQLRAEVEKYRQLYLEEETMRRNANKTNFELRAEVERLLREFSSAIDRAKEKYAEAIVRAERAEAEVKRWQQATKYINVSIAELGISKLRNRAEKAEAKAAELQNKLEKLLYIKQSIQ